MQIEIHCHTHALLQATIARTVFELTSPAQPLLLRQILSGAFEGAAALLAWYQARFQMNERGSYPDKQCISISLKLPPQPPRAWSHITSGPNANVDNHSVVR